MSSPKRTSNLLTLSARIWVALVLFAYTKDAAVAAETLRPADEKEASLVVSVLDLVTSPTKFSGRRVQVTGYWIQSFEYSGLHIDPKMTEISPIWVNRWSLPGSRKAGSPQAISATIDAAYKHVGGFRSQTRDVLLVTFEGYFEHKASIKGTEEIYPFFGYGHLGQYHSLFTIERVVDVKVVSQEPFPI